MHLRKSYLSYSMISVIKEETELTVKDVIKDLVHKDYRVFVNNSDVVRLHPSDLIRIGTGDGTHFFSILDIEKIKHMASIPEPFMLRDVRSVYFSTVGSTVFMDCFV